MPHLLCNCAFVCLFAVDSKVAYGMKMSYTESLQLGLARLPSQCQLTLSQGLLQTSRGQKQSRYRQLARRYGRGEKAFDLWRVWPARAGW